MCFIVILSREGSLIKFSLGTRIVEDSISKNKCYMLHVLQ